MNRKIAIALMSLLVICGAFNFADEILDKLGLRDPRYIVVNDLINTYINPGCSGGCDKLTVPHPRNLANLVTADKKALAKESCEWLKEYCQSAAFNTAYQKARLQAKPYNEQAVAIDQQNQENLKKILTDGQISLKAAKTPEEKAMWKGIVTSYEYQLALGAREYPMTWEWEQKYPASADSLVIRGLKYYLQQQATVDFDAALTSHGKVKVFARPDYEKKPAAWKAIFRAGKEVNEVAKAFVTNWLKEGVHVSTEGLAEPAAVNKEMKSSVNEQPAAAAEAAGKATEKPEKKSGGLFKKIKKVLD
ncbi:MAG: hypothetical protein EOO01_22505 [Chitinophagaceae bacterium]|nr:MAG: hypothetical protein EOO01_22505 [Chitinophagaceae bacterium]